MTLALRLAACTLLALTLTGCVTTLQQNNARGASTDLRDQWDIRISKAELIFPDAQPQAVANGIKEALSQFAIPANLSYRSIPSTPPARPGAPALKQASPSIPSPEYVCDDAYAVIEKRPPPVQNAFVFITEGHQVCLYSFSKGVKAYLVYYSVKKMESLTAGLFNGITRAIRGSDEERARDQLQDNINAIREELPNLLVERIDIPGQTSETPNAQAVATIIPSEPTSALAIPTTTQAAPETSTALSAQVQIEARKHLNAMGMTYHSQQEFMAAITRKDAVAVQMFIEGGAINTEKPDTTGKTPLQLAQKTGDPKIISLLQPNPPNNNVPSLPSQATENDLNQIPASHLAEIDRQLDAMKLGTEQKKLVRQNMVRQYMAVQDLANSLPKN